jgi:very-short-patch-repair endonuclease
MYFHEARLDTHRYNNYHFIIQPQFPDLILQNRSIRADLLIWKPSNDFKLIVECDGYKYHSDEESFSRDRKRDRLFKLHGYEVFRFSGKEICNEPYKCSKDLFDYLIKKET